MIFESTHNEKYSVIKLNGRWMDLKAVRELKEHFVTCKKRYVNRVILDLSECEMISSEGIGMIVSMWEFFQNDGMFFIVVNNPKLLELFKECGLYAALQDWIFEDIDTAEIRITQRLPTGFYPSGKEKRSCPVCNSTNVSYYDKGFKRLKRLLRGKRWRLVCKDCYMVWRAK